MTERRDDFLGRGWAFPPTFSPSGAVAMVEGQRDVRESLQILLRTAIGERLLHPRYGCDLQRFVFEPLTASLRTRVRDLVETAILYFEPRVVLEQVRVDADPVAGTLVLDVHYHLPSTNTRANLVLPYSLGEGGEPSG